MNKKVSIKDIAKAVGVSTALVSYVLNNKQEKARVGKQTAQNIRDKATELGYQPNQLAKSLKSGKSHTIGLIVADISNPFFAHLARHIENEAKNYNYTVIFGSADENVEKLDNLIKTLLERQVDGFIIIPTDHSEKSIQSLIEQRIPLVLVDRYFDKLDTNYVVTNNYEASYQATAHLIQRGYKNIGMVAFSTQLSHMEQRKNGYIAALKANGLQFDEPNLIEVVDLNFEDGEVEGAVEKMLQKRPGLEAVFFATNTLTLKGLKFLNEKNIKVPNDIAIVCFDESEAFDFFYAPITHIVQPIKEIGTVAVKTLVGHMEDRKSSSKSYCVDSYLVVGKSS